ncbi:hypothetical protein ENSA5_51440 [Enhygromyxa salina]|uniref:Uncharacterized protein n=1 Tax=Enhygromyxa salina TaxID=215803 RepID=A0A2S9XGV0_9BACT|nr:MXAN_2562 family outer membrane beta-barrel protein [Enhygromyxa salina]PRP92104.1 hypothetical protein ENSA5_51440 [Enhygromyxa salina]
MSAALFASFVWAFAAPPTPPDDSGDEAEVVDADAEDAPDNAEDAPDNAEDAPDNAEDTPDNAEDAPEDAPAAEDELPLDERYDPILPYGEAGDERELEYADEADELGEAEFQGRVASPQRFAIEVKFGPYLPEVDTRYTGTGFGPYATIYGETDELGLTTGKPRKGLFSVLSFEWQFYNIGGPLSLGTTVGLFRDKADALVAEDVPEGESLRASADKTWFNVVPVTVLLGYRFELLADRFRVPLVPYARGGVAYGFWWERKGGKLSTNSAGKKSHGGSFGWQVNLGLMLRLDFIDPATAIDLDRLTGINHTYVFGEWQFSHLDGFGSDSMMSVGDDTFLVGLAFEF